MSKVLTRTGAMEPDVVYTDKDMDQVRVLKVILSANQDISIPHKLGRKPNRVFLDWKAGGANDVWLSLDSSGREQADDEKIIVQFAATGKAVVCIS